MTSGKTIGAIIREIRWDKKLSQKELANELGLSVISIHSYEHDKRKPSMKVYMALIKLVPELESEIRKTLTIPGAAPPIKEKGNKMDGNQLDLLAQSQQRTIELMDEKIQALESNIGIDPIATQIWDDIHADFQFEVAVRIRFTKLDVQKKYTSMGDFRSLAKYTGYSLDELRNMYETEKWHDSSQAHGDGSDHILYSKGSSERLKSMSKIVVKSIGLFKAMVGEHYIPIPITFIAKDGERKRSMSYSKLNIVKMTGSAKFVFLNGEH